MKMKAFCKNAYVRGIRDLTCAEAAKEVCEGCFRLVGSPPFGSAIPSVDTDAPDVDLPPKDK